MKKLLIIKTGSSYPEVIEQHGDFDVMFGQWLARPGLELHVISVYLDEPLSPPEIYDAALITGSPAMVTNEEPWSENLAVWLRGWQVTGKPLLGVCYGHQILARAFGGVVGDHPRGKEVGCWRVTHTDEGRADSLLGQLPSRFSVQLSHQQSVLALPPGARHLMTGDYEPHQAFRVGHCWGLQFHPEFSSPVMRAYLERNRDLLNRRGDDADALIRAVTDTPESTSILGRFADHVLAL